MEKSLERRLITADCHIGLPFRLLDDLPKSYLEHFTHIERRSDGVYLHPPKSSPLLSMMGGAAGMKLPDDPNAQVKAAFGGVCDEAEPSFDPAEVLAQLEADGVYGAVFISAFDKVVAGVPREADIAYCTLANDWLADTWGPYLNRVAPGMHLPISDIDAAVKELERAAGMGLRPVMLPDGIWDRPYHLPEWEPLWEAANALKIPLSLHASASRFPVVVPPHLAPGHGIISFYNVGTAMGETLGWFAFSGILQRYPDLHVVCTETYAGWMAFAMTFFDHHWDSRFGKAFRAGYNPMEPKPAELDAPPSYYLKRQAHATFMWDPAAINNRELTGIDSLMWGNDYPHPEGSFPYSQQWIDKQFSDVPEKEIDAIVRGNAARIFGITI
jgi:predicted TIM-barrel fold metal-dependent hydrolase